MSSWVKSGIYIITNTVTGDCYIGSSMNIDKRMSQHRYLLRIGRHHSSLLQAAWNQHGEDAFTFDALEIVSDADQLLDIEQRYLDERHPAYNPASIALRNGAGIATDPEELERRREEARAGTSAMMATYEEAAKLRIFAKRDDDIMKVISVARSLEPEERMIIEESADVASLLYAEGITSGKKFIAFLEQLSLNCNYSEQWLLDYWISKGMTQDEISILSSNLHMAVMGSGDLPPAMTATELALNALASTVSRELHVTNDSHGFAEVSRDVHTAGEIVGHTREEIERATGRPVVNPRNMIREPDGGLWEQLTSAESDDTGQD